jgi:hypothetical protein
MFRRPAMRQTDVRDAACSVRTVKFRLRAFGSDRTTRMTSEAVVALELEFYRGLTAAMRSEADLQVL